MRAVRFAEVVEPLPFVEFGLEIDVPFVTEELVDLLNSNFNSVGWNLACHAQIASNSSSKCFRSGKNSKFPMAPTLCGCLLTRTDGVLPKSLPSFIRL